MSYPASWHFQLTQQSFQGYTPMLTSQANIYLYIAARYAIFLEMDEILRDTYEGYPQGDSIHPSKRKRIGDFVITHKHYTVAWICALHIEMAAARFMLDEENPPLSTSADDSNTYVLGSISQLNVVIACLPTDHYGTNNASNVMTNMKRTFPEIKFSLMVGIGGGVPGKFDIRLGDVIVGTRVMQYDLGKIVRHGNFQGTAVPRVLHPSLGTAVSSLRSKHELESSRVVSILLHRVEGHSKYGRPTSMDRLFCATYIHESPTDSCDRCDPSKLIPRSQRDLDVVIHYGAIASGNQVMKSAVSRDSLARQLDVICFEMEAAGLTDIVPCLPIRGICDYSDSHKNKEWQRYAAATAAAYAREFLQELPTARSHSRVKWAHDDTGMASMCLCYQINTHYCYLHSESRSRSCSSAALARFS
jgi:nucleoside phosphorylase